MDAEDGKHVLEEIERNTLQGKRDYALLSVTLYTGRRASEIRAMCWHDLQVKQTKRGELVHVRFPRLKMNNLILLHDAGPDFEEGALFSPVEGVGVLPSSAGADGACATLRGFDGEGAPVGWDELVVGSSSLIAPLALQEALCSFVSPLTSRTSVSFREKASSMFAPLRLAPKRMASKRLALLRSARPRLA